LKDIYPNYWKLYELEAILLEKNLNKKSPKEDVITVKNLYEKAYHQSPQDKNYEKKIRKKILKLEKRISKMKS